MQEVFLPVVGYEGIYEVSNLGRVRSMARVIEYTQSKTRTVCKFSKITKETALKPALRVGYPFVVLTKNHVRTNHHVHRLVAIAFIPNHEQYPQVNHIDGIKTNNEVSNLEWCNASMNGKHAFLTGLSNNRLGSNSPNSKLTDEDVMSIRRLLNDGVYQYVIAKMFSVSQPTINAIHKQRRYS